MRALSLSLESPSSYYNITDKTLLSLISAAVNNHTNEGVAIKKVTNVFSKKILAKRALREIKLLQHFRGHRNVSWINPYVCSDPLMLTRTRPN